jgi:uncharacterized protein (DUF302 family)
MMMEQTTYAMRTTVNLPFEKVVQKTKEELKKEGFGVLTEIDVRNTLKEKLGKDFKKYVILGACNPPLAFEALSRETEIGLMLPCNVIVYEGEDGRTVVSALDPVVALSVVDSPQLNKTAQMVAEKLGRVIESLEKQQ